MKARPGKIVPAGGDAERSIRKAKSIGDFITVNLGKQVQSKPVNVKDREKMAVDATAYDAGIER